MQLHAYSFKQSKLVGEMTCYMRVMQISIDHYGNRRKAGQFAGKDEKVIYSQNEILQ